jgi:hypothetical protein
MAAEHPTGVVPGAWASGHVNPVEGNFPQRQTQENRRRLWLTTAGRRNPDIVARIRRRCVAAASIGRVPLT